MHFRRLACLILGAWLAAGMFMAFIATDNFRGVDRLLRNPATAALPELDKLGHDAARTLLRYEASEFNRRAFEVWETLQLGLGVLLFFVLLFGTEETKFSLSISLLMLAIVVLQRFFLTPEIIALGRTIDFVPADPLTPGRAHFRVLHAAYTGLELVKWVLGLALAARLILRHRRSRHAGQEIDLIDKANHGHVDW